MANSLLPASLTHSVSAGAACPTAVHNAFGFNGAARFEVGDRGTGLGPTAGWFRGGEQGLGSAGQVGDDRVPDGRAGGFVGIVGDVDEAGALRQVWPGDLRVVPEDRCTDDDQQIVSGQCLEIQPAPGGKIP